MKNDKQEYPGDQTMTFEPENALERALMQAATDPAYRPQFYKDLLSSDLLIIQHGPPPPASGEVVLQADTTLEIQNMEIDGRPHVPVFSSLPRLQAVLTGEAGYLAINALDLFEIVRGSEVVLNPGSEYGKVFTREEIESLVDGSIFKPSERYVTERATQVTIGQPANLPVELIEALNRLFSGIEEVQAAYLAHFFNPERDERPHTLIGLEVSGEWDRIAAEAGMVAEGVQVPDPPVDFIQITGKGGLVEYLRTQCQRFFHRPH